MSSLKLCNFIIRNCHAILITASFNVFVYYIPSFIRRTYISRIIIEYVNTLPECFARRIKILYSVSLPVLSRVFLQRFKNRGYRRFHDKKQRNIDKRHNIWCDICRKYVKRISHCKKPVEIVGMFPRLSGV